MATWSAPGKVFLFGEHAVVYGKPGIAMAIKPRVQVTVRKNKYAQRSNSPYIAEALNLLDVKASVYVKSQLPSASGLGSSAAVTVATMFALNDEFQLGYNKAEVTALAHEVEKLTQNGRASATDTYVSAYGGMVLIRGDEKRRLLPPENFSIVIGNSLVPHHTVELVRRVADFHARLPAVANPIFDAIGAVTLEAMHNFENPSELGSLMNRNQALLEALGVGHPALTRLNEAAKAAGAFGSKLSGAGGGGCVWALCPRNAKTKVVSAFENCAGKPIPTAIDLEGVRKEEDV